MPIGWPSGSPRASSSRDQLVAGRLVLVGFDQPVRLAALDVDEQPAVVAARAPGGGLGPVDLELFQAGGLRRRFQQDEVALLDEPLVERDPAVHALGAVVGDDDDVGVGGDDFQEFADLAVDVLVVVGDDRLIRVAGLVAVVAVVHVLPEGVVDAVGPHLDHHEEVPRLGLEQVLRQGEPLVGHPDQAVADHPLVGRPEVADVELVGVDVGEAGDLVLELGRVGVVRLDRRGEEVGHHPAVDRPGRVRLRDAEEDHLLAGLAEVVPEERFLDRHRRRRGHLLVRPVRAVAEPVVARASPGPCSTSSTSTPGR